MGDAGAIAADNLAYSRVFPDTPLFSPSDVPGAGPAHMRQIATKLAAVAGPRGVAVVETTSGDIAATLALAEAADALVILVARLDDDIAAAARAYGSRLAGVVVNAVPRYRWHQLETVTVPAIKSAGAVHLGAVPEDRRLLAPSMDLIASHLDAPFALLPENGSRLVDNFLIGGLVLDWGPTYFGSSQNTCVVVRGDRPDVQLAALQTETTLAMVMTKGIAPIEYVHYEAAQRGIPIVVSPLDTHQTALKLESLLTTVRFDHPDKLVRMVELAESGLNLAAIERAVAQPATR